MQQTASTSSLKAARKGEVPAQADADHAETARAGGMPLQGVEQHAGVVVERLQLGLPLVGLPLSLPGSS